MAPTAQEEQQQINLTEKIVKIFEETRTSHATHIRKLKELLNLFRQSSKMLSPEKFFAAFSKALTPLFDFSRRTASAERIIKFVAVFATFRSDKDSSDDINEFLEQFLRFLIMASTAADKNARLRACQIISEVLYFDSFEQVCRELFCSSSFCSIFLKGWIFILCFLLLIFFFGNEISSSFTVSIKY